MVSFSHRPTDLNGLATDDRRLDDDDEEVVDLREAAWELLRELDDCVEDFVLVRRVLGI